MRKKMLSFAVMFGLLLAAPLHVQAEVFSGGDDWKVEFDGEQMNSTFKNADIDDAIYQLQPGDTVNIHLSLENSYAGTTNWYMTNEVLQSLEDSQSVAEGGAYTYILEYVKPDGSSELLYSSEAVGGETVNESGEGLHQATDSLKDYFYLDQLAYGESAEIQLTVKLEGETQGNEYQDTLAKLQMNFAVEVASAGTTDYPSPDAPEGTRGRLAKTGDNSDILLFTVITLVSGLVCVLLAVIKIVRDRKKEVVYEDEDAPVRNSGEGRSE